MAATTFTYPIQEAAHLVLVTLLVSLGTLPQQMAGLLLVHCGYFERDTWLEIWRGQGNLISLYLYPLLSCNLPQLSRRSFPVYYYDFPPIINFNQFSRNLLTLSLISVSSI